MRAIINIVLGLAIVASYILCITTNGMISLLWALAFLASTMGTIQYNKPKLFTHYE